MSGDYSLAIGDGGLRLGVNGSALSYRVTQSTFAPLQGNGNADTLSLYASYPLRRQTRSGLTVAGNVNRKHLKDSISGIETNHRATTVATVGLSGWEYVPTINGMATFGADVSTGRLDRSRNAGDLAQDQLGRRSDGHFDKLSWRAGHIAALGDTWSLATRLNGQFANRGLDSSERFTLGGPTGVRAYAASEGSGDEGWFLSLNLMRSISDAMNLQFFIDHGQTRLNKTLWTDWNADNPRLSNRYSLSGIGAGIDWKIDKSISLNLTLATPLGKNPGRDSNGLDSDGRHTGARLWASLVAHF
jgi:hemolysin activation/secretion protein